MSEISALRRLADRPGFTASRALVEAWDASVPPDKGVPRVWVDTAVSTNGMGVPRAALLDFVQHLIENPTVQKITVDNNTVYDLTGLTG